MYHVHKIQVSVSVTKRQKKALDEEATKLDISRAELVRRILDEWMEGKPLDGPGASAETDGDATETKCAGVGEDIHDVESIPEELLEPPF